MPKICNDTECEYPVWGKGYCRMHQYLRTDPKKPKPIQSRAIIPKGKFIKPISDKRRERLKGVSEMDIFLEIWEDRKHISELSGEPLFPKGHAKWHFQFLHILPKGTFPDLRIDKDNIILGLPDEHDCQEDIPEFRALKVKMLRKVYDVE